MALHERAGQTAQQSDLINVAKLISDYYTLKPDANIPEQAVIFGTSGHRGCAFNRSFNEAHIAAIAQALAEYRQAENITGPCYVGMDTHALSEAALTTTIQVLCANNVEVVIQANRDYTPTPVISHAILRYNHTHQDKADGIVITPSHNPPQDGGFKYNAIHGGPADTDATSKIQKRANDILLTGSQVVKWLDIDVALNSQYLSEVDFAPGYINDLANVIDMQAIASSQIKLGADPLGGAGARYWRMIAQQYDLDIEIVNHAIDQRFSFMSLDKDGQIRMDCSSPYAMAGLLAHKDKFILAFGNDADFDRHGIVTPLGLMNPNHYLAVAIDYVINHRPQWSSSLQIGKTLVSSSMIDRVVSHNGRELAEMPVGFKWFVQGLLNQSIGFAGEESAGGIFLRLNGQPWATDKDGFILCLLAAEMTAVTGTDPAQRYLQLTDMFGTPHYKRIDVATTLAQKHALSQITADVVSANSIAGEPILSKQTHASGNGAAIGGLKVTTENGWFAARPSGTENVYKIYAESFISPEHLDALLDDAQALVNSVIS